MKLVLIILSGIANWFISAALIIGRFIVVGIATLLCAILLTNNVIINKIDAVFFIGSLFLAYGLVSSLIMLVRGYDYFFVKTFRVFGYFKIRVDEKKNINNEKYFWYKYTYVYFIAGGLLLMILSVLFV